MIKFLFLIIFFPTLSFGQTINTTHKSGEQNIYNDAMKHYITFASKNDKSVFDTLLLFKNDLLTDSLQATIQRTKIITLDSTQISNRLQGENSFVAYKIFPLSFDNGYFYINIVLFVVRKDKGEIVLVNSGTCIISYIYDKNKKSFKFYRSAFNSF